MDCKTVMTPEGIRRDLACLEIVPCLLPLASWVGKSLHSDDILESFELIYQKELES